jgi:nucleotidyltransferase substrate binding protein (TIGR01987 family)
MKDNDIRWEQRFSNYRKALLKLSQAIKFINESNIGIEATTVEGEIIKEGLIQRFEYTHELGWNVMKDFAEYQGNFEIKGSRDATREAFQMKLITQGEIWMDMILNRNKSSHTYNEETANEIYLKIMKDYYPAFLEFAVTMEKLAAIQQGNLFDHEK